MVDTTIWDENTKKNTKNNKNIWMRIVCLPRCFVVLKLVDKGILFLWFHYPLDKHPMGCVCWIRVPPHWMFLKKKYKPKEEETKKHVLWEKFFFRNFFFSFFHCLYGNKSNSLTAIFFYSQFFRTSIPSFDRMTFDLLISLEKKNGKQPSTFAVHMQFFYSFFDAFFTNFFLATK